MDYFSAVRTFRAAYLTKDAEEFMALIFPPEWKSISSRIIETGVSFSGWQHKFAPRWTQVPATVRKAHVPSKELESYVKSCIYRAHDLIHQLWGLPIPGENFTEDDFYSYKRAQMCGEVSVLMFTEFVLCKRLSEMFDIDEIIRKRNAIPMLEGPLAGRTHHQIAARLDTILHKKLRPKWVRDHKESIAFVDDYVPMLQRDRDMVDHNWALMKRLNWLPIGAPNQRYSSNLDGMELTLWMVDDFFHLMDTDPTIDRGLAQFNKERRSKIILPEGWDNI